MPLDDSTRTTRLLQAVNRGNREALDRLLNVHRKYVERLVQLRMEPQLSARLDPSDIVQEALVEATCRMDDFLLRRPMTFRVWLRQTAIQRLIMARRQHLEAQQRAADREQPLPDRTSLSLARELLAGRASQIARREELAEQVREAVGELSEHDRDILLMRNYEGLSNAETAEALGIEPVAASKRYGRALLRLRDKLKQAGLSRGDL